ncbi:hypothetical protein BDZ91DRAFT_782295 [Kalaharituber pfeilii]|nr:hypothetical protein BDZ91DRAFT_782295 [Kalaharituber pfeilii]
MESADTSPSDTSLITSLHTVLHEIHSVPLPATSSLPTITPLPATTTPTTPIRPLRRASVALIIRVQPSPSYLPPSTTLPPSLPRSLSQFFAQEWVAHGTPEVLFIKRADRRGDRWTGHVGFPGGKRDEGDVSDEAAARREVQEEIGMELRLGAVAEEKGEEGKTGGEEESGEWNTLLVGALPERILSLPPTKTPPLRLQPTEIHSTYWVPLSSLLTPSNATTITCPIIERLTKTAYSQWIMWIVTKTMGRAVYGGVRLEPSISVYAKTSPAEGAEETAGSKPGPGPGPGDEPQNLILWGLTHAIVFDVLNALPPRGSWLDAWEFPTFTVPDVAFVLWVLGRGTQRRNLDRARKLLEAHPGPHLHPYPTGAADGTMDSEGGEGKKVKKTKGQVERRWLGSVSVVHNMLLDDYWEKLRK